VCVCVCVRACMRACVCLDHFGFVLLVLLVLVYSVPSQEIGREECLSEVTCFVSSGT